MLISSSRLSEELKEKIVNELASHLSIQNDKILINLIDISINESSFNLNDIEKIALIKALSMSLGNISKTASLLGVTRRTVYSLIKKYSIEKFLNTCEK